MRFESDIRTPSKSQAVWFGAGSVFVGILLRVIVPLNADLWQDEIIAATHAQQRFLDVIISSVRYDVHPPLYFLQLHLWSIIGQSDQWLMINSVLWSLGAVVSLWLVGRRVYSEQLAWCAAGVFSLLPGPVYMADQVRMYGMLSVLFIWGYFYSCKFSEKAGSKRDVAILTIVLLAIVLTHAIGIIAVGALGLFSLPGAIKNHSVPKWLAAFATAGIVAIPFVFADALHDANLFEGHGVFAAAWALSSSMLGLVAANGDFWLLVGVAAFLFVLAAGLLKKDTSWITLSLIVAPLFASLVIAIVFKPIFKWNFFSTFLAPFVSIIIGTLLTSGRRSIAAASAVLVLVIGCASVWGKFSFRETSRYEKDAAIIAANYRPGDVVFVPQMSNFWGIARYLWGPGWGSDLRVAASPSKAWQAVYRKLGPNVVRELGLGSSQPSMLRSGFEIATGTAILTGHDRVWLVVNRGAADLPKGFPPASLNGARLRWKLDEQTSVFLYASEQQAVKLPVKTDAKWNIIPR